MPENTTENSKDTQSWLMPQRKGGALKPGLYLIATPIGNLGDITLRALDTLAAADVVVCEDTRVSGKLLSYFGLKKKLQVYNDHSDKAARNKIVNAIDGGQVVALVSDAGMPLISDPGFKLIQSCYDAGVNVTSLPGANAPLAALQLSGLPSDQFSFLGFLPSKTGARVKALEVWRDVQSTLITFENASRVPAALKDIRQALEEREVVIARELTKMYEEIIRGSVSDVIDGLDAKLKGEVVLVIQGAVAKEYAQGDIEDLVRDALKTMSTKEAAAHVAGVSGWARKEVYEVALKVGKDG